MKRNITIEDLKDGTFAISTEVHDGIIYSAESVEEAVRKYEKDRHCEVGNIAYWSD